ncbi:MAG: hypothetical protein OXQ31_19410 [Spirochaetaceae bacterium]|nr:hypothetical protein [Spirochaetaceae bacterium]
MSSSNGHQVRLFGEDRSGFDQKQAEIDAQLAGVEAARQRAMIPNTSNAAAPEPGRGVRGGIRLARFGWPGPEKTL